MKNFTPKNKNAFYILSGIFLGSLFVSCTSTQGVYSDNDGIYGSSSTRVVTSVQEVPGANYQRYFETEANNIYIEDDEIFTDIDGYVGYSDADQAAVQIEGDYNYGNTPWGYNDSNVSINFHMGFGYGGNWGYNPWRWGYGGGYWGWNDPWWGYPGYGWGNPGFGWGYPGYGWGYPGYGWGYPGYGWGYPGYGWGNPIYRPPYYGGTYGKRNNYPVRYADNGRRTGYTRTSQAGSTRPNIYKNSVAQNASSRSTNYKRNATNAVNNGYQRYNQQSSNRNTNSYNRNSNSRSSYSPSMGGSSGYSRGSSGSSGSSGGMRSSSGGRRNGPNVVSNDQGSVNQSQSTARNYRSTGRPVNSDFRTTLNAVLNEKINSPSLTRYVWKNGQAYRVNLDETQRQEFVNRIRTDVNSVNEGNNRNYSSGKNSTRSNSYESARKNQRVASSNSNVSSSSQKSSRTSSVSKSSSSSPSRNVSVSSSSRSSSSGSSYTRSSGGGSRKQ
jgi:hypothetical protein